MRDHPTEIELELARTGEADQAVAAHLEACDECRARMDRIAALAVELGQPLAPVPIPEERERALLEQARERADAIRREAERRPRRALRRLALAVPLAAAAAVALVLLVPELRQPETPAASEAVAAAGPDDVNRDGKVDILDAFAVARALDRGQAGAAHDATGDGKIDRSDVDRLALAAVAVGSTGGGR